MVQLHASDKAIRLINFVDEMATEMTTPNNNHGKRTLFQNVKYQCLAVLVGECTHLSVCLFSHFFFYCVIGNRRVIRIHEFCNL